MIARVITEREPGERRRGVGDTSPIRAWRGVGRLGVFACVIVLVAFMLNAVIDSGLRRINTSSFGVSNRIVDGRINADILITGSSRALTHYDPRIIEALTGLSAFNIGSNGSQTDMQLARLKTYLRHNKKPLLLIHNLDLFSFQTTHGGVYDPGQYIPYLAEPAIYDALARIDPDVWKAKFVPLYGYAVEDLRFTWMLGILGFFGWNPVEDHFLGFEPRHSSWTGDFERFKEMNPAGARFEIEPEGAQQLEDLLRLCRDRRIAVLLVYSPEYAEMQALTMNRPQVFARFKDLGGRFDARILDYSASSISAHKENFYNSQHLNAGGAAAFSRDLAEKIVADPVIGRLRASPADSKSPP